MSRGLGARQLLMLRSLRSLEREYGDGRFYVWAVLQEAVKLDGELSEKVREHEERIAKRDAEGGGFSFSGRRAYETKRPRGVSFDGDINPSRVFALLEQRGLVTRQLMTRKEKDGPLYRKPTVKLTDAGRALVDGD